MHATLRARTAPFPLLALFYSATCLPLAISVPRHMPLCALMCTVLHAIAHLALIHRHTRDSPRTANCPSARMCTFNIEEC